MFGFKRNARQVVAVPAKPVVDRHEVAYAHSWGFKYNDWLALTPKQRADYRDRVVYAPNFNSLHTAGN